MMHVLNNLQEDYDMIEPSHFKQCWWMTIDVIWEKLNHRYEKIKKKNEEKREKEKALGVYKKHW